MFQYRYKWFILILLLKLNNIIECKEKCVLNQHHRDFQSLAANSFTIRYKQYKEKCLYTWYDFENHIPVVQKTLLICSWVSCFLFFCRYAIQCFSLAFCLHFQFLWTRRHPKKLLKNPKGTQCNCSIEVSRNSPFCFFWVVANAGCGKSAHALWWWIGISTRNKCTVKNNLIEAFLIG